MSDFDNDDLLDKLDDSGDNSKKGVEVIQEMINQIKEVIQKKMKTQEGMKLEKNLL